MNYEMKWMHVYPEHDKHLHNLGNHNKCECRPRINHDLKLILHIDRVKYVMPEAELESVHLGKQKIKNG